MLRGILGMVRNAGQRLVQIDHWRLVNLKEKRRKNPGGLDFILILPTEDLKRWIDNH